MKNHLQTAVAGVIVLAFVTIGATNIKSDRELNLRHNIDIQSTEAKLKIKQLKLNELHQELDEAMSNDKLNKEQIKQLEGELKTLEGELQAKRRRESQERQNLARAANRATGVSTASAASYSGNKESWLRAAGIPQGVWWAVDSIVSGESGWNPNAVNPSSGACGLGQQLPCGKWGGDWRDPVHALRSMNTYVQDYGGWAEAVQFRNCTGSCWSNRTNSTVYKSHTWY